MDKVELFRLSGRDEFGKSRKSKLTHVDANVDQSTAECLHATSALLSLERVAQDASLA